ncbi:hypothetical protein [Vreelandella alkaliphila]|uniref:Uncharacterized protein n=1 Tax=Vreelandella alkaliphila TaxID=272774 RepID=A0A7C9P0A0_9GAMM|nr:hypothetical protein [Halomonas alkaliphila]NDL69333.1 hypothetical protein [Halomonas alkaliphila]
MDDELKAIQDDLDNVLERLEAYINDKNSAYKLFEMESPHGGNPKAEMRDALYLYLSDAGIEDIDSAISRVSAERMAALLERNRRMREYGEEKGKLLFALEEVARHRPLLANYSPSTMVQPEDMANLAEMASRYLNQEDQYPGEYGSKQALKRKGRRARYTVEQREAAMNEYIRLRREHGKHAYPLERDACQPIADKHGIESGQAIVDAVRQRLDESFLTGSSNGGIVLTTLREYLSIND